jgi:hypothetical protein
MKSLFNAIGVCIIPSGLPDLESRYSRTFISNHAGSVSGLSITDSIDNPIWDLREEIDARDGLDHDQNNDVPLHGVNALSGRFAEEYSE